MLAVVVAEGVAVLLLAVLVAGLLRSHAEILRALHDLGASLDPDAAPGGPQPVELALRPDVVQPRAAATPAADVVGVALDGDSVGLGVVGAPHQTLLAFLSSGCATCGTFWAAFAEAAFAAPGGARAVIVVKDAAEESLAGLRELAPPAVPVVLSSRAWSDYAVPASPYFVLVDGPAGRVVGEGSATRWPQVADLIRQAGAAGGRGRVDRDDADLLAAGIGPGHPSLYAQPPREEHQ